MRYQLFTYLEGSYSCVDCAIIALILSSSLAFEPSKSAPYKIKMLVIIKFKYCFKI